MIETTGTHSKLKFAIRPMLLLFFQLCLVFILFAAIPGDPVRSYLGPTADQASVEQLRHRLGLDDSRALQFVRFLRGVAVGDLGYSLSERALAGPALLRGLIRSAQLACSAVAIAVIVALTLGYVDALVPQIRACLLGAVDAISTIPAFVAALLFAFALLRFHPASISPPESWGALFLPAVSVAIAPAALLSAQLLRACHRYQAGDAYLMGRAVGLSRAQLFTFLVLPTSLFVWLENLKNVLATVWLLTLIAEFTFSIRGLSSMMVQAVQFKDAPLLQGFVVINCVSFALAAELIDLARFWVRPR